MWLSVSNVEIMVRFYFTNHQATAYLTEYSCYCDKAQRYSRKTSIFRVKISMKYNKNFVRIVEENYGNGDFTLNGYPCYLRDTDGQKRIEVICVVHSPMNVFDCAQWLYENFETLDFGNDKLNQEVQLIT